MFYTPLSNHDILPESQEAWENYQHVTYNNKQGIVEKTENGDWRIAQLLSTNPNDFLIDDYLPGTIIKM
ncbi:hypothetical protein F9U64_04015 [Gracilibacillus oryzae]|uniref:YlzJ-like protein n=1 Tax=Gracilibacillus oryzae TaxID=1672701 RepID=A0A7C8KXE5_9BACI|nr:YlzJ-like family protein [Gracilibacillus oryzae]KAB8138793.1 hypothetical protein F9U64_04015 [Gracilibacillus oryzae]